jgi:RNA polymerase sigma-70 factor (ECF subfamily)
MGASDARELAGCHLFHAARADLFRRLGRNDEAIACYRRAHELAPNDTERRYLARRLRELGTAG